MDPDLCERRTPRRMSCILASLGLTAAMLAMAAPGAGAAVNSCRARNVTQGTPSRSDLHVVIKAAHGGDTIVVRGICKGHFEFGKNLNIVGKATAGVPRAVLRAPANGARVLWLVKHRVSLTNLIITTSTFGGGIYNTGNLTLRKTIVRHSNGGILNTGRGILILRESIVRGNDGGILNYGTLMMNGSSSVRGNDEPGGIINHGTLVMSGSSSVSKNTNFGFAADEGGGIINHGTVVMSGSSSVSGNVYLNGGGGGIANYSNGLVILKDAASVSENTANMGGGIYDAPSPTPKHGLVNACDSTGLHEWVGAISPNSPDDPPVVTPITCT